MFLIQIALISQLFVFSWGNWNSSVLEKDGFVINDLGLGVIEEAGVFECQSSSIYLFDQDADMQIKTLEMVKSYCSNFTETKRRPKRVAAALGIVGLAIHAGYLHVEQNNIKGRLEKVEHAADAVEASVDVLERISADHAEQNNLLDYRQSLYDLFYQGHLSGFLLNRTILNPIVLAHAGLVKSSLMEISARLQVTVNSCEGTKLNTRICYKTGLNNGNVLQVINVGAFTKAFHIYQYFELPYFFQTMDGKYIPINLADCSMEGRTFRCAYTNSTTCEIPSGKECDVRRENVTTEFTHFRKAGDYMIIATNRKSYKVVVIQTGKVTDHAVPSTGAMVLRLKIGERAIFGEKSFEGEHEAETHCVHMRTKHLDDDPLWRELVEKKAKRKMVFNEMHSNRWSGFHRPRMDINSRCWNCCCVINGVGS